MSLENEIREWDELARRMGRLRVLVGEPFSRSFSVDYFSDVNFERIYDREERELYLWPDSKPVQIGYQNQFEGYRELLTMRRVRDWVFELVRESQNLDWFFLVRDPRNIRPALRELGQPQSELRDWGMSWILEKKIPRNVFFGFVCGDEMPELREYKNFAIEALLREPVRRFLVHRCYQWFDFESVLCLKDGIDWVVIEPELPNARPMNPNWVRDVISACKRWQIPVFFRGWGDLLPAIQYRPKNDIAPFSEWTVTRSDGQPMRVGAIPDLRNYVIVMREDSGRKLNGNEYLETPN